jgi:hypothetical protein
MKERGEFVPFEDKKISHSKGSWNDGAGLKH